MATRKAPEVDAKKEVIRYRVFEPGVNRETLTCGARATAVAGVAYHLEVVKSKSVRVKPVKARLVREELSAGVADDSLVLENAEGGWWLEGPAEKVYTAELRVRQIR